MALFNTAPSNPMSAFLAVSQVMFGLASVASVKPWVSVPFNTVELPYKLNPDWYWKGSVLIWPDLPYEPFSFNSFSQVIFFMNSSCEILQPAENAGKKPKR